MQLKGGTSVLTGWVPRQGEYLRATLDLIARNAAEVIIRVFTRRSDATGNGVNVDPHTKIATSTVGRSVEEWGPETGDGMKEMIRYKLTVGSTGENSWALFRMLSPLWFDAVLSETAPPP